MLTTLRSQVATKFLNWSKSLDQFSSVVELQRHRHRILIFFHGYSLAHTIRPLVLARTLRERGYHVDLAGRGPHIDRVRQEGFAVHDVETLPQSRMDEYIARGEYDYYDLEWIDRCVRSERELLQALEPELVVQDMKPTAALSARLEGVDEAVITQAYAQPDYPAPIHLPERFTTQVGPFGDYLKSHAAEVKPQRTFHLVADVPEFHAPGDGAPGYHYIGPLLDRPEAPERVPVLDEGWNTDLPLVYLTCGSSGRAADYLDALIELFEDQPYRLLVTTAGRWSGTVAADNVRVVDYVPGEWALARAQVLVGVVGIGAIYQALSCSVPIIGAPEHLDQEYHLNQVEALGVGIKLRRKDFTAERILEAVKWVISHRSLYEERCAPLSRCLEKWSGGGWAADLVDSHFRLRHRMYRADDIYLMKESEFVHYLDMSTPTTLPRESIVKILHRGIRKGIPHQCRDQSLYFDRVDSWNWLYDNEPLFFQADYKALEKKRQCFFSNQNKRINSRSTWQKYRVEYRYRLWSDGLHEGQRVAINLPYPVASDMQKDIRLLSCTPGPLADNLASSMGFFYGYQFTMAEVEAPWEFAYICEVAVSEQALRRAQLTNRQRRRYLEVPPELEILPEVAQCRRELGLAQMDEPERKAQVLYDMLARQKRFKKTKDSNQSFEYSVVAVLNDAGGHCLTLSRAYIALCRLEGIPAREVCGALIGYPTTTTDRYASEAYKESIFGHTWVEIFLEDRGWLPVEFHGIAIGRNAATQYNVTEPDLRALIDENSDPYFDYYFGQVDNQRLLCSNSVKTIEQCLVECEEVPAWDKKRWQVPEELRFSCQLEVECI